MKPPKSVVFIWKKYGVLRNKNCGDSWFARFEFGSKTYPYVEELRFFKDRSERDAFIKEQNRLIKIYGHDEYYNLYRNLIK